jgi:hypothetical protein
MLRLVADYIGLLLVSGGFPLESLGMRVCSIPDFSDQGPTEPFGGIRVEQTRSRFSRGRAAPSDAHLRPFYLRLLRASLYFESTSLYASSGLEFLKIIR